jgi:hypothetical protein
MFRTRLILAALALVALVPLVGCAGRRCCGREPVSYAAPAPCPPPCPCPTGAGVIPG